jgi:hypothetical protein
MNDDSELEPIHWFGITYHFTCHECSQPNAVQSVIRAATADPNKIEIPKPELVGRPCQVCNLPLDRKVTWKADVQAGTPQQLRDDGFPL